MVLIFICLFYIVMVVAECISFFILKNYIQSVLRISLINQFMILPLDMHYSISNINNNILIIASFIFGLVFLFIVIFFPRSFYSAYYQREYNKTFTWDKISLILIFSGSLIATVYCFVLIFI